MTDLVLNLLLFLPFGVGLALLGGGPRGVLLLGVVASTAIECAQWFWLPSRDAAWHDILTNGAGALIGGFLVHSWETRSRWGRLAGPSTALAIGLAWIAGAGLVRPTVPRGVVWYGFWAHQLGNAVQFPGRILEFAVNRASVPDGVIQDQAAFERTVTRTRSLHAVTRVVIPPPYHGLAQLVGIMSPSNEELVSLWQDGNALLGRVRLMTTDVGLRTPWFVLLDGLNARSGDTLTIGLEASRNQVRLTARGTGMERTVSIPLAPELFWASFVPWDYAVGSHPAGWPLLAAALIFAVIGVGFTRYPLAGVGVTLIALFLPVTGMGAAAAGSLTVGLALASLIAGMLAGRLLGVHRD